MNHLLVTFFVFILSISTSYSQNEEFGLFPRDEEGKINFSEVVQVDNLSKKQLYTNSKIFFAEVFKSANEVIQMDDEDMGILIGKGFNNVYAKSSIRDGIFIILDFTATVQMWFTIKLQLKDGRYKYEIYDIYFIGNSEHADPNKSYAAEYIFNKERLTKKRRRDDLLECKESVENEIQEIINALKKSLDKKTAIDDF